MKLIKKRATAALAALLACSLLAGGALNVLSFAKDEVVESPIIPIKPPVTEEEKGLVFAFNEKDATATVVDFTDDEAALVRIPETVTENGKTYTVNAIGEAAFSASVMTAVVLPDSVQEIASYAFDACMKLEKLFYEGEEEAFLAIRIAEGNEQLLSAEMHYDACMKNEEFRHTYTDYADPTCDACGKTRVMQEALKGDLDGKDGVSTDDAVYLLFHVNFPDLYPVNQAVDYDGSGEVDVSDVIHLLYHVNFPERYPLH